MKPYRTLATICLFGGRIGLDDRQASRRAGCLKKIKRGEYAIEAPIELKAGEIIGLSKIPKPFGNLLEKITSEPREKIDVS